MKFQNKVIVQSRFNLQKKWIVNMTHWNLGEMTKCHSEQNKTQMQLGETKTNFSLGYRWMGQSLT